jgi:hypothetical protein
MRTGVRRAAARRAGELDTEQELPPGGWALM